MNLSASNVTIRTMRRKDVDAVVRMGGRLNAYHGDNTKLDKSFLLRRGFGTQKTVRIWVAAHAGVPIGFAITNDWANFVHSHLDCTLNLLFVEEDWRGKGIGHMLTAHAATTAKDRGCVRMMTTSAPKNLKAKHFYQSLGFIIRPVKPNTYLIEGKALHKLAKQKI